MDQFYQTYNKYSSQAYYEPVIILHDGTALVDKTENVSFPWSFHIWYVME